MFIHLQQKDAPEAGFATEMKELAKAGHPVFTHGRRRAARTSAGSSSSPSSRPRWRAGCSSINPFDQPNVQEAKDDTKQGARRRGELPEVDDADDDALRELLGKAEPPHYVAIMGYVQPSDEFDAAVDELRVAIRDATKATTTFGYGPRFLHSTGPVPQGRAADGPVPPARSTTASEDVEIPEAGYTFSDAEERAGDRRPADAARARPAGRAGAARGAIPPRRVERLTQKIKEML